MYKGTKKIILLFCISLFSLSQADAQKIDSVLNVMAVDFQPEKIYIQYDKEYYVAGETIWFKAFLFQDGKPSGVSSNFYLQFINSKGQLVMEKKYPVMGAVVKGNIELKDTLPEGNYFIRALTPGMLNGEEEFIYKKNIFVLKPATVVSSDKNEPVNLVLQFFPESGKLIDGILSVVGFKATDQRGMPIDINGIIKSDEGTTIASFKSFHDGIGKIQFKPQAGKKYSAEIETAAGKRSYSLPEVSEAGINLKIQDEKGGKKFQLARSAKNNTSYENLLVVAQINNHVVYETEIVFEDYPSVIGHLLTDSLPSGILHFTVFNKEGVPLAERLTFIDNEEYKVTADVVTEKIGTGKREENILEIQFPDTIQRSCAVAIIDEQGEVVQDKDNIWSRFLLTSDLKGYINNPAWYFNKKNDTTKQALDNLVLIHGWSRFNWTKILSGEFPTHKYTDIGLISLSGKVLDPNNNAILSGGKLNFFVETEDSISLPYEAIVNADGTFRIDSMAFLGKSSFFYAYTGKQEKPRASKIILDRNSLEDQIRIIPQDIAEKINLKSYTLLQNKDDVNIRIQKAEQGREEFKELENVNVKAGVNKKPVDIVNEKYTSGVFRSPGKVNLDNINEPANDKSMNVVDYIKNRIRQLEIQGGTFVNRKNLSLMSGQMWKVGIFVNEVPADINQLRVLRVDNIALVKFYEAGFVGVGSGSPGGALAVYTKEKFVENKPDMLESFQYNGYSITKEFYKPDYSITDIKHKATDNRTTLYWNPDVYTDMETKSVRLNFYNNDFSKKFRLILEGFDAAGRLIYVEKVIGN